MNYDEIMERLVFAAGTMIVTFETNISKLIVDCMGFIEKQQVEIDELKAENKLLKDELSHDEVLNLINDSEQELVLQRISQREEDMRNIAEDNFEPWLPNSRNQRCILPLINLMLKDDAGGVGK